MSLFKINFFSELETLLWKAVLPWWLLAGLESHNFGRKHNKPEISSQVSKKLPVSF